VIGQKILAASQNKKQASKAKKTEIKQTIELQASTRIIKHGRGEFKFWLFEEGGRLECFRGVQKSIVTVGSRV
jgi:hypothetical protein